MRRPFRSWRSRTAVREFRFVLDSCFEPRGADLRVLLVTKQSLPKSCEGVTCFVALPNWLLIRTCSFSKWFKKTCCSDRRSEEYKCKRQIDRLLTGISAPILIG